MRANTSDSGLNRATAVGLYPRGATKIGIRDLAGTLAEWCSNAFDDPDDVEPPTTLDDRHVVRGGSWRASRHSARTDARGWSRAGARSDSVGFRVVRELAIADP